MNALTPKFRKNGSPFESFRHEMDDWTRRFFGAPLFESAIPQAWAPSIDVAETDKEVVLKADVPGVDPKDMDISVADGSLLLRGHKTEGHEEKGKEFRRLERFEGDFYRELALPVGVDPDKVSATYSKGVVTVTLPKKPSAQTRKVTIKPID